MGEWSAGWADRCFRDAMSTKKRKKKKRKPKQAKDATVLGSPCPTEQLRIALAEALSLWAEDGLSTARFHDHERLSAVASGTAQKKLDGT